MGLLVEHKGRNFEECVGCSILCKNSELGLELFKLQKNNTDAP